MLLPAKNLFNCHTEDPGNSQRHPYSILSKPLSSLNSGLISGQAPSLSSSANSMNTSPPKPSAYIYSQHRRPSPSIKTNSVIVFAYWHEIQWTMSHGRVHTYTLWLRGRKNNCCWFSSVIRLINFLPATMISLTSEEREKKKTPT